MLKLIRAGCVSLIVFFMPQPLYAAVEDSSICDESIAVAAQESTVPRAVLMQIARLESGRKVNKKFVSSDQVIHLSVQANTINFAAVKFWKSVGVNRIILSRELSLDEVKEIRQECPDIELEVFVHGALCIAYSGRCLLSGYFNHRDPNPRKSSNQH